jgi:hypothetical protein
MATQLLAVVTAMWSAERATSCVRRGPSADGIGEDQTAHPRGVVGGWRGRQQSPPEWSAAETIREDGVWRPGRARWLALELGDPIAQRKRRHCPRDDRAVSVQITLVVRRLRSCTTFEHSEAEFPRKPRRVCRRCRGSRSDRHARCRSSRSSSPRQHDRHAAVHGPERITGQLGGRPRCLAQPSP